MRSELFPFTGLCRYVARLEMDEVSQAAGAGRRISDSDSDVLTLDQIGLVLEN